MRCLRYLCNLFTRTTTQPETIIKWEDTVEFTFPITGGRVIKVYDADTITIATRLPFKDSPLYRLSVRLNGIDAPGFLDFLELALDSEDPYEYVKELTKYIDKNIINYKGDKHLRLIRSKIIIGVLSEAINDNVQQLNEAISNNKSSLARVVGGIVELSEMNVNNNL